MIQLECPSCNKKIKFHPFSDYKCCKISFFVSFNLIRILDINTNICILSNGDVINLTNKTKIINIKGINYNSFLKNLSYNYYLLIKIIDNITFY